MDFEQVLQIIKQFYDGKAASLKLCVGDTSLELKKPEAYVKTTALSQTPAIFSREPVYSETPVADTDPSSSFQYIQSPLVGTFYQAAAPGEEPFVKVGQRVKAGETVCLIDAMKMINEVPALQDCVIEEVMLADGALAAFEAPLFRIREL